MTAIKIKHIVRLSTNERSRCHECNYVTGKDGCIDRDVDHYITEHGYQVMHVGQETTSDDEGRPWHSTVVVLGVEDRTNFDRTAAERAARDPIRHYEPKT